MHKQIEDYVDDIVVKSKVRENHFNVLRKVFEPPLQASYEPL